MAKRAHGTIDMIENNANFIIFDCVTPKRQRRDIFNDNEDVREVVDVLGRRSKQIQISVALSCKKEHVSYLHQRGYLCKLPDGAYCFHFRLRINKTAKISRINPVFQPTVVFSYIIDQPFTATIRLYVATRYLHSLCTAPKEDKQTYSPRRRKQITKQARQKYPMSGSPKGWDRVEPWMNSTALETKPFEGGKCSPR